LRTGTWLTRERLRLVAMALLFASSAGLIYLVATAHGGIDLQGRPLGTDFSDVYAAGTYVNDGDAAAVFDPAAQIARERAIFPGATQVYGWHYPPYFLFVAGALAKMPYGLALAVWLAASLGLYLLAIWAILATSFPVSAEGGKRECVDSLWLLLALAFPAVLINIGHGQNGFLTAALLGGALALLDRRPALAGVLIGLLAYKPQFGLMIPLTLGAGGYWRSFAAAALTVALLTVVTSVAFSPQIWHAFLGEAEFTRSVALEQGSTGWYKMQSVFAWTRMWGGSVPLAYAIQSATIIAIGTVLVWLWRGTAAFALKAAALCLAALLATPYSLDYDMMVLAPAIAFFIAHGLQRGFGPWEKTALAALWLVPLVARSVAQFTLIPLGVPAMLGVFILILRRAELRTSLAAAFAGSKLHRASPGLDPARE
jgi:alpha-1,2-mannosyltransferase